MRNSLKFIGKSASLISATTLLMATTAIIPAEAANKAGARCTKVNAKAKIGGDSYVCTKNPTVKNAKLTWVWVGCMQAHSEYLTSVKAEKAAKEKLASAVTMFDLDIATLNSKRPEFEKLALDLEKKATDWKSKASQASAKAKILKDSLAAKNFTQKVDKTHLDLLRSVLKPPVDTTLTAADITLLTSRWGTTSDKLELWFDAIQVFALEEQIDGYLRGEKQALESAKDARAEISKQIAEKEKQKSREQAKVENLGADLKSQLSLRKMACSA